MKTKNLLDVFLSFVQDYYDGYGRHYHDLSHIQDMISRFDEISKYYNKELPISFIMAVVFHDVIYIPGFDKNEEASIQFMKNCIRSYFGDTYTEELIVASQYIESTAYHNFEAGDLDEWGNVFLDLDLISLTGNGPMKDVHFRVLCEYTPILTFSSVDAAKAQFIAGRSKFFTEMLKKRKILKSKIYENLESSLRKNLEDFINDPYSLI